MSHSRSLPDTLQLSDYLFLSILQADQDISSSLTTHSSAQKPSMAPYDLRTRWELLNLNCKIQPMSELLLFPGDLRHEPSRRHSRSHMFPPNGVPGCYFKTPTHGIFSFLNFLLSFPCPWSLYILTPQEDCCTAESRSCLRTSRLLLPKA